MRLLKLTPASNRTDSTPNVYVSASQITDIEVRTDRGPAQSTIVYVNGGKWREVLESPEAIEQLANSDVDREPSFHALVDFARWYSQHQKQYIGRSYAAMVDAFISDRRNGANRQG